MRFDILTIFPDIINSVMGESIIGRAQKKQLIEINAINIRDYTKDKHKKVDDYPYGGGSGMVMMAEPIYNAYNSIVNRTNDKPRVIYMSPQGKNLTQDKARELLKYSHIVILCGHYEGVDERIIEEIVDEEISIGDYVLTGGELPAMVLIDTVCRMVPCVLPSNEVFEEESHYNGLLEHPQYTRPHNFNGKEVPSVLLSGHHLNISKWRREQAIERNYKKRPELLEKSGRGQD